MSWWVHPATDRIVKFFPHNPPERGDVVLVNDVRCRVLNAKVRWDGATWTLDGVEVTSEPLDPSEEEEIRAELKEMRKDSYWRVSRSDGHHGRQFRPVRAA